MATTAEALALALQYHQAGNLQQAEQLYRQILQAEPAHADALHLLGVLAHQLGRQDLAVSYIRQALAAGARDPTLYLTLGNAYFALGQLQEAATCFRDALRLQPNFPEAHYKLGNALQDQGQLPEAEACYREALRLRPGYPEACNDLGRTLQAQGRMVEAGACYQQALFLKPNYPEAYYNLGVVQEAQGQLHEAAACYQEALRLNPHFPEAQVSLGNVLQEQGKLREAEACFREALRLRPGYPEAHLNLGNALREQGSLAEAAACYRAAISPRPNFAEAHHNLGVVLQEQGRLEEAAACLREALRLKPAFAEARVQLGDVLQAQGRLEEAAACLEEGLRRQPTAGARIALATLLPPIYRSMDDLLSWRQRLMDNLHQLHQDRSRLDLNTEMARPVFFLAYQGYNERATQREIARLYAPPAALLRSPPGRAGEERRIRVGFLSAHFGNHTVGLLNRGFIAHLSRDGFEVIVLSIGRHQDEIARFIQRHADRHLVIPARLAAARQMIAQEGLDVLFYADIGMEPVSYSLAFSRLAPVQCTTWGHSLTTGIPAIDYYLSSELFEPADAEQHYTEQLVRLQGLGTYYYRPAPPPALPGREQFGLGAADHVYACPQSLFKFHPAFDELLAGILRADPCGVLVLLRGFHPRWEELLAQRWAATLPDVRERVHWVPHQDHAGFLSLNAVSDVLLDPFPFGGCNTSLEALALGVPVVTLPSPFLRGRFTLGLYQKMGVLDCVASSPQQYVAMAVRLGTDAGYREAVRAKIRAASGVLYEDLEAVRELEQFFRGAVDRARREPPRDLG